MSHRLERVNEMLKREIGEAIRREVPVNEAGLITVNEVKVAPDLQHATVFVSILGGAEQQNKAAKLLEDRRKLIQGIMGRAIVLKYTPQLRFVVDDSIARGNRILEILDDLEKITPPPADETAPKDH